MPVDRFRFVSPGVFINEIDQTQVSPAGPLGAGPVVFGVAQKGPPLIPTTVASFGEFVRIFGRPQPGAASNGDIWREGNRSNPTYGAYGAQAYLGNGSPLTFVRLVGDQDPGASAAGQAGWDVPLIAVASTGVQTSAGSTYGLFIVGSGSAATAGPRGVGHGEGMLGAIFYLTGSRTTIGLSGDLDNGPIDDSPVNFANGAAAAMIKPVSVGAEGKKEFKVVISGSNTGTIKRTFNFDPTSARYIRNVFNTNPQLLNSAITPASNLEDYFLGESFGRNVVDFVSQLDGGGGISRTDFTDTQGVILAGISGAVNPANLRRAYASPATPWIIAQDMGVNTSFDINSTPQKLFRLHARDVEFAQRNYKISFADIKASTNPQFQKYGTFTLLVRALDDTDENPTILEQFNLLDLNPASNNYIAKRIGDKTFTYDTANTKWQEVGEYDNRSNYIRVELDEGVAAGEQTEALLPFGYRGIPTNQGVNALSGAGNPPAQGNRLFPMSIYDVVAPEGLPDSVWSGGSGSIPAITLAVGETGMRPGGVNAGRAVLYGSASVLISASLLVPTMALRSSSADGRLAKNTNAFFGLTTNQAANTLVFDGDTVDMLTINAVDISGAFAPLGPGFSLDNIIFAGDAGIGMEPGEAAYSGSEAGAYWSKVLGNSDDIGAPSPYRGTPAGARRIGTSCTAQSASYTGLLDRGFDRFTVPLYGGFNGWDITERNPLNNARALNGTSKTVRNSSPWWTIKKAIDSVSDVDQININVAAIPGVTDTQTTDWLLAMAEERKDTLAIIDLEGGYTASTENTDSVGSRKGSSATTVTQAKARDFNNSYGAAYYPWVQITDNAANRRVWLPSSAIALGVLAASDARAAVWFAPAGFNRGGLNNGSAGLNVVNVIDRLTSDQRDNLYEVNINPIASFPAEGLVVFGQKTLQAKPSALDRINVRRLMIFLKKQITRIANGILFDPNVQITWNRFLNDVEPFLGSIKNRFGLADYRVILDSSTTTPDLIDRNILYAKILLKPTRAIEFIALDFVITNTGVEF